MHYAKDLYVSPTIGSKIKKIIRNIKYGTGNRFEYLVYFNERNNRLEFMRAYYFSQSYFKNFPFEIKAVTSTYKEALEYIAGVICTNMCVSLEATEEE